MKTRDSLKSAFAFCAFVALLVALCIILNMLTSGGKSPLIPTSAESSRTVVIDAGHGGLDGGAVASDGTLEKDINLQIAGVLAALMRASGYKVVMTRDTDVMLDTSEPNGSAKMRDLRRRLEISSASPGALTVSIHCNKFPQQSCKGLQVYHSASEQSEVFAKAIQSSSLLVMPENHRQIKKADSSIYLLHRATNPAVLVECGFISNPEELSRLKTTEYKKQLALVIMGGIDSAWQM